MKAPHDRGTKPTGKPRPFIPEAYETVKPSVQRAVRRAAQVLLDHTATKPPPDPLPETPPLPDDQSLDADAANERVRQLEGDMRTVLGALAAVVQDARIVGARSNHARVPAGAFNRARRVVAAAARAGWRI